MSLWIVRTRPCHWMSMICVSTWTMFLSQLLVSLHILMTWKGNLCNLFSFSRKRLKNKYFIMNININPTQHVLFNSNCTVPLQYTYIIFSRCWHQPSEPKKHTPHKSYDPWRKNISGDNLMCSYSSSGLRSSSISARYWLHSTLLSVPRLFFAASGELHQHKVERRSASASSVQYVTVQNYKKKPPGC